MRRLYDADTDDVGYVMNLSRVWGHLPAEQEQLFGLVGASAKAAGLSFRDRGILVTAAAATLGDSYCALAWGNKLAGVAGTEVVEAVLTGADDELTPAEQALARWARQVVADPKPRPRPTWRSCARPGMTTARSPRSPCSSGCGSPSPRSTTPSAPVRMRSSRPAYPTSSAGP